jgi:hypothetical protein
VGSAPASIATARYARGTLVAAIVVIGLWHLMNDLPAVVTGWSQHRAPAAAVASAVLWLAYTVLGTAAAAVMLRPAGGSAVLLPAIAVPGLLIGTAVGVLACPPGQPLHPVNWPWGSFGWFALLLLWRRPLRWLVAALALNALVVLATTLLTQDVDRVTLARWGMIVYGTSVLQIVFAWGARFLERDAARAAEATTAYAETVTARVAGQAVHEARRRRYQDVQAAARDFLAGLASGRLDPADYAVRRRSAMHAARLRRLLAEHDDVPDPLVHELRACADVAERRGVSVDLEAVGRLPPVPVQVRRALAEAPIRVLTAARTRARITVAGTAGEVAVGVVADADLDEQLQTDGTGVVVAYDREGEQVCLESIWHAP